MWKRAFLIVFFLQTAWLTYAQTWRIDSLNRLLPQQQAEDSMRARILVELSFAHLYLFPDSTLFYANKALDLAQKTQNKSIKTLALNRKGLSYWIRGDLFGAFQYLQQSLHLAEELGDENLIGRNVGNIGLVYFGMENPRMALKYYHRALQIFKKRKNLERFAVNSCNAANAYLKLQEYDSAEIMLQGVEKVLAASHSEMHIFLYHIWGHSKVMQKDYASAKKYLYTALRAEEKKALPNAYLSIVYALLAEIDWREGKLQRAEEFAEKGMAIAQERQMKEGMYRSCLVMSKIAETQGDLAKALKYKDLYILYKDSVQSEATKNSVQIYDYQREQGEIATLHKEKTLEKIRTETNQKLLWSVVLFFFLASVGMVYAIWQKQQHNRFLKQQKEEIWAKNEEISQQREKLVLKTQELENTVDIIYRHRAEIQAKNQELTDSITYALRIQNAIIPKETELQKHFDCFVLFRPKDIVSGDFYWFAKKQGIGFSDQGTGVRGQGFGNSEKLNPVPYSQNPDMYILAVADCTGHGVSGAFMTMIGNNILNQIVHDLEIHEPDQILNQMPILLEKTLSHSEGKLKDGMDISIITITQNLQGLQDLTGLKISYAGAMNPLYCVQNQELMEIKADKIPIGGQRKADFVYQKHEIRVQGLGDRELENSQPLNPKPCTLYLCSDGYQDQFGGGRNRKFMVKNLKNLLLNISEKAISEQKRLLEEAFDEWKGESSQTDDVLVVGLRIA